MLRSRTIPITTLAIMLLLSVVLVGMFLYSDIILLSSNRVRSLNSNNNNIHATIFNSNNNNNNNNEDSTSIPNLGVNRLDNHRNQPITITKTTTNYKHINSSSWNSPQLFHRTSPTLIEGAILVKADRSSTNPFYFKSSPHWYKPPQPGCTGWGLLNLIRYSHHCGVCFQSSQSTLKNKPFTTSTSNLICPPEYSTGTLTIQEFPHDDQTPLYGLMYPMALRRSHSAAPGKSIPRTWETLKLQCRLNVPLPSHFSDASLVMFDASNSSIIIKFDIAPYDSVPPQPPTATRNHHQHQESVVCSRGLFGNDVESFSVRRFVSFYLEKWKFDRVIMYQVGLDRMLYKLDAYLINRIEDGSFIIIDVREQFQHWYGFLSTDAALFSATVAQVLLKTDCYSRARALQAKWTLHVDMDEFLVESRYWKGIQYSSFNEYAQARHPNLIWLSFGKVTSDLPSACDCNVLDFNEFIVNGQKEHELEWEKAKYQDIGPFWMDERNKTYWHYGRAKLAIRVDGSLYPDNFGLGFHRFHPCSITHTAKADYKEFGMHVEPKSELYLREYRCINQANEKQSCSEATFMRDFFS
jgi:hypothetical protein